MFAYVRPGEAIWFDDGQIGGVVREVNSDPQHGQLHVEITYARPRGSKLRADKGINLPDSALQLPAITAADRAHVPFVAANADLVGYSFVHSAEDVIELQQLLAQLRGRPAGHRVEDRNQTGLRPIAHVVIGRDARRRSRA